VIAGGASVGSRENGSAESWRAGFAIGAVTLGRLRMDFADWAARMRTTPDRAAAIRTLQTLASSEVE